MEGDHSEDCRRQYHAVWVVSFFLDYRNNRFDTYQSHLVEWQGVDLLPRSLGFDFVWCVVDFWRSWLTCLNDTS